MKNVLLVLAITLITTLTVNGQNLFFIGEYSYPSTENITLQANSDESYIYNVDVIFAKQGTIGLIALSTKTLNVFFRDRLIIYLDNGTVITCNDAQISDYVDGIASVVYYFKNEDLSNLKNSNINTVRYTLKDKYGDSGFFGGDFSASNRGTPTKTIITNFFDNWSASNKGTPTKTDWQEKPAKKAEVDALLGGIGNTDGKADGGEGDDNQAGDKGKSTGDPNASGYYGNSGTGSGGNYRLGNRKALIMPKPDYDCNEQGKVYVSIYVDKSGKVISATPGARGTTNTAACLLQRAKEAALKTKFNADTKAPAKQEGTIIYNFTLSK